MKDAYSFDLDEKGLDVSYQNMYKAYCNVFDRLNINYKIVLADTGAIGGTGSHQFMALSDVGESDIAYCPCGYAADVEKASCLINKYKFDEELKSMEVIETPKVKTIEEVSNFLNLSSKDIVKTLVYIDMSGEENVPVIGMVRGDRELNEIKLVNALGIAEHELRLASYDEILAAGLVEGFAGPVGVNVKTFVDEEVAEMKNIVVGANKKDHHIINVNYGRDFNGTVLDLRTVENGDLCPVCGAPLSIERGIEVGQIFKLGTKYSKPMNCTYQNEQGENVPMVMGCYGIGVTRTMSSIIEQHHDEFGIKWPLNVAPYHAVVVPINYQDPIMREKADAIYAELKKQHVEVILDDRDERPGFKFKDWELIGIPYTIVVGRRAFEDVCEFKIRETLEKTEKPFSEAISEIVKAVKEI